jgi:hypothetical protein
VVNVQANEKLLRLSDTQTIAVLTLAMLGASLLLDSTRFNLPRVKLFLGLTAVALAGALATVVIVESNSGVTQVDASTLPAGGPGTVDHLSLSTSGGKELTLAHYGYGAFIGSDSDRATFFVGRSNGPGELVVRSREPGGARDSGAATIVRDSGDQYSLGLDFKENGQPTVFTDAPFPLRLETRRSSDIVIQPSGRPSVRFDAQSSAMVLPNLPSAPPSAPDGALMLVRGQLVLRSGGAWRSLGP